MIKPISSRNTLLLFSLIGLLNTLFDITLYTFLRFIGQSVIASNIISVSAALIGSYLLNSQLTFKSRKWTFRSFAGFIIVTLIGLWVIQTGAIYVISAIIKQLPEYYWHIFGKPEPIIKIFLPKLLATAVSFVWNYIWYNKVIFRDRANQTNAAAALGEL
jgi:putative flippase GtrA